jgi:long-chain acyl-CoA synthetase
MSLDQHLRRHARERGGRQAFLSDSGNITFGELDELAERAACGLREAGIGPGHQVGLMLRKRPETMAAFFGIMRAGAVAVPLNVRLEDARQSAILDRLDLRLVLAHEECTPQLERLGRHFPPPSAILVCGGGSAGAAGFGSLEALLTSPAVAGPFAGPEPEDTAYIDFTSGSTGSPKGALTTHRAITANTASVVQTLGIGPQDIHLPLFAISSHPHEIFARSVTLGGTAVLLDSINPKAIAAAIEKWRVTCVMGLPPIYEVLLNTLRGKRFDISSLRLPESGGMVTPWDLIDRFNRQEGKRIVPVWGSTETAGVCLCHLQALEHREEGMGRPCQGVEVRVLDGEGCEVPDGEVGEMAIRSASVFRSYLNNGAETSAVLRDGEYLSRDMVRRDSLGCLHFAARRDEMMKVAGLKVYPAEIEQVLRQHPNVVDVVVAAARSRARGVIPMAHVVLSARTSVTELKHFCRRHLASYKVPRIFEFLDELPRTGSGKPDRRSLSRL